MDIASILYAKKKFGGGGGGGDFTINKLIINNELNIPAYYTVPVILESPMGLTLFPRIGDPGEYDVVVYSGGTVALCTSDGTITVSGNITQVGVGTYLITGDCEITVN